MLKIQLTKTWICECGVEWSNGINKCRVCKRFKEEYHAKN